MAFLSMDDLTTDTVRVTSNQTGKQVSVTWGATTVRLTVAEAVDLVDAVAMVLGNLPEAGALGQERPCTNFNSVQLERSPGDLSTTTGRESYRKQLARDEDRVRTEAEVRESL